MDLKGRGYPTEKGANNPRPQIRQKEKPKHITLSTNSVNQTSESTLQPANNIFGSRVFTRIRESSQQVRKVARVGKGLPLQSRLPSPPSHFKFLTQIVLFLSVFRGISKRE
jgi:hypothetical protein